MKLLLNQRAAALLFCIKQQSKADTRDAMRSPTKIVKKQLHIHLSSSLSVSNDGIKKEINELIVNNICNVLQYSPSDS